MLQATSHVLVMQIIFACTSCTHCGWSLGLWACRWSARTTLEKSRENGHLMVPSCSVALSSMYSTILADVGRHRSVRSFEAASVHMGLAAHASPSWSCWPRLDRVGHVPCVPLVNRLTCISTAGHILCSGHADHFCMHKLHTLLMVHLGRPVVREDHF